MSHWIHTKYCNSEVQGHILLSGSQVVVIYNLRCIQQFQLTTTLIVREITTSRAWYNQLRSRGYTGNNMVQLRLALYCLKLNLSTSYRIFTCKKLKPRFIVIFGMKLCFNDLQPSGFTSSQRCVLSEVSHHCHARCWSECATSFSVLK